MPSFSIHLAMQYERLSSMQSTRRVMCADQGRTLRRGRAHHRAHHRRQARRLPSATARGSRNAASVAVASTGFARGETAWPQQSMPGCASRRPFQECLSIEESLDEIFRRYGDGRIGGRIYSTTASVPAGRELPPLGDGWEMAEPMRLVRRGRYRRATRLIASCGGRHGDGSAVVVSGRRTGADASCVTR